MSKPILKEMELGTKSGSMYDPRTLGGIHYIQIEIAIGIDSRTSAERQRSPDFEPAAGEK